MSRDKIIRILLAILLLISGLSFVQGQDNQLWLDYNLTVPVSKTNKFTYGGDAGYRRGGDAGFKGIFSTTEFNQVIIRPTARYRLNQVINVGGGMGGFFTFNKDANNNYEFRMQEEVNVRWPDLSVLAFFYRVRFDQRFISIENTKHSRTGRVRYLAGIESQDFRAFGEKRPFYFQFFWEGFKTLGRFSIEDTFINQDRITGVFGHRLTNLIRYEIVYFNQRQRGADDDSFEITQHILRIRFFHRIVLKERSQPLQNLP